MMRSLRPDLHAFVSTHFVAVRTADRDIPRVSALVAEISRVGEGLR